MSHQVPSCPLPERTKAQSVTPQLGADGEIICSEAGQCVITFSNASPIWSRTFRFSVGVIEGEIAEGDIACHAKDSCMVMRAKKAEMSRE